MRLTEEIDNLYSILDTVPDKDTLNILFIKGLEYSLNAYVKPGYGGQGGYYNFDRAIAIHPNNHKAWVNRGIALDNLDRLEEAIASYDQVLTIKFDDYNVWCYRGNALYNLGRLEEAIASYDRTLSIKPDDHHAWNNRGIALANVGRFEEALTSYNQAIALDPDDPLYQKNKEELLAKIEASSVPSQTTENPSPENPLP